MESSPNTNPPSPAATTLSPRAPSSPPTGRPVGRTGSPPWTQIVRGPESDSAGAPADISLSENPPEIADNSNAGSKKAAAWNKKPSNGSVDSGGPVVMGALSWPALSESTKASPKLSPLPDSGSPPPPVPVPVPVTALQVTGLASSSSSSPLPSPSQSAALTSQKPTTSNANHFPSSGRPARQKSMKRDGGGNAQANGGFSHQPLPHGEGSNNHNSSVKPSSSSGNESSGRDNSQNHGNRESGPRNAGGDHHQPRNSFRRGNSGGPHSRGDGTHQNYGGRRGDQDRGNHDWNHQRSFNGRDAPPMQSRGVGPRGFVRTPPVSAPFVHPGGPAPMRPFINPMGMPDMPMIYFSAGVPIVAPVHPPMFFPAPDPQLLAKIVNQIDYYFSNENLIKDAFLRLNMDQNGWVPVSLIAGFKKVMQLTDNIQLILEAVRSSTVVEAQGDKIRRRNEWIRWIMPPTVQFPTTSSLQSPETPNVATLSADIQSVSLNERTTDAKAEVLSRSSSGNLHSSLHTNNDGAASSGC